MPKTEESCKILERSNRRFSFQYFYFPGLWVAGICFTIGMIIFPFTLLIIFVRSRPDIVIGFGVATFVSLVVVILLNLFYKRIFHAWVTIDKKTGTIDIQKYRISRNREIILHTITRKLYPLKLVEKMTLVRGKSGLPQRLMSVLRVFLRPSESLILFICSNSSLGETMERSLKSFLDAPYLPENHETVYMPLTQNLYGESPIEASEDVIMMRPTPEQYVLSDTEVITAVGRISYVLGKRLGEGFEASLVSESDRQSLQQAFALTMTQRKERIIILGESRMWFDAGVIAEKLGMATEAEGFFSVYITLKPKDTNAWTNLGIVRIHLKNFIRAEEAFKRVISLDPKSVSGMFHLGHTRISLNDFKGAMIVFEQIITIDPKNAAGWASLGLTRFQLKDFKGTVVAGEKAIAFDPSLAIAWANLAAARMRCKDFQGALEATEKAITLDPSVAIAWSNLAALRMRRNDFQGALEANEKAITLDPSLAIAWSNLAGSRIKLQNFKGALQAAEKAITIEPGLVIAWGNLGHARADLRDIKGALEACDKAISLDPAQSFGWGNLGYARKEQGDLKGAVDALERALALDPEDPDTWQDLGLTFERLQKDPEALYCFERSAALGDAEGQDKAGELHARGISARAITLPDTPS